VFLSTNERALESGRITGEVLQQIEIVGAKHVQRYAILWLHFANELFDLLEHVPDNA
jgi:hypothetical protein